MRLVHEPLSTNRTMKALINRLSHTPLGILLMSVMLYQAMPFSHNIAPAHAADTQVSPSKSSNQQVSDTKKKAQVDIPFISRMAKEKERSASGVAQKHRTHKLIRRPATVRAQSDAPVAAQATTNGGATDTSAVQPSPKDSTSTAQKSSGTGLAGMATAGVLTPVVPIQVRPLNTTPSSPGSLTGSPSSSFAAAGGSSPGPSGSPGRNMQRLIAEMPALSQILTPPSPPPVTTPPPSSNPAIGMSPTSLSFTAQQGSNPATQTVSISNTGGGTLSWSASDNAAWLTLSPASGSGSSAVTATVSASGLAAGTYNATVTIAATGATNTPKTVPVTLTVNASTTSSATLTWNANTESDLAGYKVYSATVSGAYGAPIATIPTNTTTYQATGLSSGTTYFFVVTAYNTAGNESIRSNEVSKNIF